MPDERTRRYLESGVADGTYRLENSRMHTPKLHSERPRVGLLIEELGAEGASEYLRGCREDVLMVGLEYARRCQNDLIGITWRRAGRIIPDRRKGSLA